jgi:hypothetical protein
VTSRIPGRRRGFFIIFD